MSHARLASALDEIIERRRIERPYPLYRHIAERVGVHSTTLLRYHTGYLRSAPANVYAYTRELLLQARAGHPLPFEGLAAKADAKKRSVRASRVPAAQVRHALEGLLQALGMDTRQILFRYLAERTGSHASTMLRYFQGDLQTAPVMVLDEIARLREQIVGGDAVVFRLGPGGSEVVLRERTRSIVEELLREPDVDDERSYCHELDRRLALPPGTTRRICTDPDLRFVHAGIHKAIEELVHGVGYDPILRYEVGERIRHHIYGPGTVVAKIHKNKMRVEFLDGEQVILSEAVPEDPYRYLRSGGGGSLTESGA